MSGSSWKQLQVFLAQTVFSVSRPKQQMLLTHLVLLSMIDFVDLVSKCTWRIDQKSYKVCDLLYLERKVHSTVLIMYWLIYIYIHVRPITKSPYPYQQCHLSWLLSKCNESYCLTLCIVHSISANYPFTILLMSIWKWLPTGHIFSCLRCQRQLASEETKTHTSSL